MPKKIRHEKLRKLLQERKRKLLADLHDQVFEKLGSEYHGEFEHAMDSGDVSFMDLLQSIGVKIVDIRQEELIKMDESERKLREGTYGICEECEEPISLKRLEARPETTLCIRCKEDQERNEKAYG